MPGKVDAGVTKDQRWNGMKAFTHRQSMFVAASMHTIE